MGRWAAGLRPGALHEVFAEDWSGERLCRLPGDAGGGKQNRCSGCGPITRRWNMARFRPGAWWSWAAIRANLILVRTANAADALSAASDILACPHVGALLLELGRRIPNAWTWSPAAGWISAPAESGVTAILLRDGAQLEPSAAQTRWHVACAPLRLDDDWGVPGFRRRTCPQPAGPDRLWTMTWNPDNGIFREHAPLRHSAASWRCGCRACRPTG